MMDRPNEISDLLSQTLFQLRYWSWLYPLIYSLQPYDFLRKDISTLMLDIFYYQLEEDLIGPFKSVLKNQELIQRGLSIDIDFQEDEKDDPHSSCKINFIGR